jgi:micrococcal nuclease
MLRGRRTRYLVMGAVALSLLLAGFVTYELLPRTPELDACRAAGSAGPSPGPTETSEEPGIPPSVPPGAQAVVVVRVVDGDGICVRPIARGALAAGRVHEIRLIGINAPGKKRCRSRESAAFAAGRIGVGRTVFLSADEEGVDRYGRFLRYVWDADGALFNVEAVRLGAARALIKAPNDRYADRIRAAEAEARSKELGVWRCFPWRLLP